MILGKLLLTVNICARGTISLFFYLQYFCDSCDSWNCSNHLAMMRRKLKDKKKNN
jgi:hypothetical protein